MKKLLIVSSVSFLLLTSIATSKKVDAANAAQSLCEYVAADDKMRMRSFLKTNKLKIRRVFQDIQCNGQNLLHFASTSGSIETGSLIISKLPKKIVANNIDSLRSGAEALFDAANARIN